MKLFSMYDETDDGGKNEAIITTTMPAWCCIRCGEMMRRDQRTYCHMCGGSEWEYADDGDFLDVYVDSDTSIYVFNGKGKKYEWPADEELQRRASRACEKARNL